MPSIVMIGYNLAVRVKPVRSIEEAKRQISNTHLERIDLQSVDISNKLEIKVGGREGNTKNKRRLSLKRIFGSSLTVAAAFCVERRNEYDYEINTFTVAR